MLGVRAASERSTLPDVASPVPHGFGACGTTRCGAGASRGASRAPRRWHARRRHPCKRCLSVMTGLQLNPPEATERIATALRLQVGEVLKRRGLVVAMSGGIDSSVCAALAVRALGPLHVFGLMLPERESDGQSLELATDLARTLGIDFAVEEITPVLEAFGCYRRRNAAIRRAMPELQDHWRGQGRPSGGPLPPGRVDGPVAGGGG